MFIAYTYKINAIMMRPIQSREDNSIVAAFSNIYDELETKGHKLKLHVLDNECSRAVHNVFLSKGTAHQNVKTHNHQANTLESAAKTAKYHLISHIATLDFNCPIQLWAKMLTQIEDTLNILRTSRNNSTLTIYEELKGAFDWNKTPMALLGTKALVFIDPEDHNMFTPHYIDASMWDARQTTTACSRFLTHYLVATASPAPIGWTQPTVKF